MKYRVKRRHLGERQYEPGDEREAQAADVRHLIEAGILIPVENKAEKPAETKRGRAKK